MDISNEQLVHWLAMAGIEAKRSKRDAVLSRAKQGKCLLCEAQAKRRGLCDQHYMQFHRGKLRLDKVDRISYEKRNIEEGRVLASGQLREIMNPNPFLVD